MTTISNLGIAQTKTNTTSSTKSSESYNYSSTFNSEKKQTILNYLKKEIGENYSTSKQKLVWSKVSDQESKDDKAEVKLEDSKIEVKYQNKNNLLNPSIVKKLKKISDFIESITK